ncbi:MAG: hemolysin III family protein [Acholeplasmatales bacterium]|nr:hemolysin III family protein [Acholeplasmatales bacterium]
MNETERKERRKFIKKKLIKQKNKKRNEPPNLPLLEEIGNSVTHGIGTVFGIVSLVLMLVNSHSGRMVMASLVYGISIIVVMLNSTLYHAWKRGSKVKYLWRRFDYTSIYLLVAGTYAPLQLVELSDNCGVDLYLGVIWFCVMWGIVLIGIIFNSIFGPGRIQWLNFPLYFLLGWFGLIYIPIWIKADRIALMLWILFGGLVYTLGMIPFVKRGKRASHFIWHIFVLLGAIVQFIGIFIYIYN